MARDEYDHLRESADTDSGVCPFCGHTRHADTKCGKVITEGDPVTSPLICPCATGNAVIHTIVDEIDAGEAHLMTRNELKEFIAWITMGEESGDFFEQFYTMMNSKDPVFDEATIEDLAKRWFVKCGYENA